MHWHILQPVMAFRTGNHVFGDGSGVRNIQKSAGIVFITEPDRTVDVSDIGWFIGAYRLHCDVQSTADGRETDMAGFVVMRQGIRI